MRKRPDLEPAPPQLLPWGRDGVPGELRAYIAAEDDVAREERGEAPYSGPAMFRAEGVVRIADRERARLAELRKGRDRKDWSVPADIAAWAHLLHAYCAYWGEPAPAALVWLTFELFALQEGKPPAEITAAIGLEPLDKWQPFLDAAQADGEADAAGEEISVRKLAEQVGVSRPAIDAWRSTKAYQDRRSMVASAIREEARRRARKPRGE